MSTAVTMDGRGRGGGAEAGRHDRSDGCDRGNDHPCRSRNDFVVTDPGRFLAAADGAVQDLDPGPEPGTRRSGVTDVYDAVFALLERDGELAPATGPSAPDAGGTRIVAVPGAARVPEPVVGDRAAGLSPAGGLVEHSGPQYQKSGARLRGGAGRIRAGIHALGYPQRAAARVTPALHRAGTGARSHRRAGTRSRSIGIARQPRWTYVGDDGRDLPTSRCLYLSGLLSGRTGC
jgi:hypothetical protein